MSADTDIEFDDDFLREVEALEAAVLRSRGETALSDRPGASCHTSAGTNASRPTKSNQQPDLALIVPASGQAATIVPHAEEPKASSSRESYCISRTSMFESGCREEEPVVSMNSKKKAGKEHCDLSQEDGQKSNNLQSLRCKGDGDVGTMTYRWTVDTICVQDSMHCRTKRMQEVVGKVSSDKQEADPGRIDVLVIQQKLWNVRAVCCQQIRCRTFARMTRIHNSTVLLTVTSQCKSMEPFCVPCGLPMTRLLYPHFCTRMVHI